MAVDGLAATTVLRGELGGSLLARAVGCPKRLYIEPFSAVKTLAAITAFVPLFAILPAVFFDLLRAAKKALDFFPNQENRIIIHDITLILSGNEIRRTQNAAT